MAAMPAHDKNLYKSFWYWSTTDIVKKLPWVDLDLFKDKIKHRKILEHKISWKVLKILAQNCSDDDTGLTFKFYGKIKFAFRAFTWKEFMELIEYLGAKVNKCSEINEYINIFCNIGKDHSVIFLQYLS